MEKQEKSMSDELAKARSFANSVRYSGDKLRANNSVKRSNDEINSFFSMNSMLINPLVTPSISKSIDNVIHRLQIPKESVKAYVYASSDIQAECHAGDDVDCVIRLSSGLIDILDNEEIEFVIGHEIGHFIYSHGLAASLNRNKSLEFSIQQRAQEISADRIGLLACNSLDYSIRAMMKTMSGLSSKYLNFNIGAFLSQLSNTKKFKSQIDINSTHPSILIRCRALLWFSMSETFKRGKQNYQANEVNKLNNKIKGDIDKFVDSVAHEKIERLKHDVVLWLCASKIIEDNKFDNNEQKIFSDMFGEELLGKLKSFLSSHNNASTVKKSVSDKLNAAINNLQGEIPASFEKEMAALEQEIKSNFV